MANEDIGIVIGGDASQLTVELQRAVTGVQQFGQSASSSLNGMLGVVNGLTGATQSMAQHFAQLNAAAGRDAFSAMAQGMGASAAAVAANNAAMDAANAKMVGMRGQLEAMGAAAKGAGGDMQSLSQIGAQLGAAFSIGYAVNKMLEFRSAIQDAQITMDKLRSTLTYGVGSGAVGQEMDYLRKQTNALGLEFTSASVQYTKLAAAARGTTLAGLGVRDMFESVGKAGTVMGLSAADMQGVFLSLTQMMSKGTVQAEEFRGQLGERLPGSFEIGARAIGATTSELNRLMEAGQLLSSDFLPKFAAQLEREVAGSFDTASRSAQASVNRLTSSWDLLKMSLADDVGIGKGVATLNNKLAAMLGTWTTNIRAMAQSNGLQQFFMAAIYDSKGLSEELEIAQNEFAKLSAQHEKSPKNIYINSARADLAKYILALDEAKKKQDELNGSGKQSPAAEAAARGLSAQKAEEERATRLRSSVQAVQTSISGESPNFQKHLATLQEGFTAGIISQAQYVKDVQELVKKEGGIRQAGADHIKSIHDARFALQKASEEQTTASMSVQVAQQQKLNDLAYKGGSIDLETFYARKAALETQAIDRRQTMLQQELADAQRAAVGLKKDEDKLRAQERIVKVNTQLIELGKERVKVDGPEDQALRGWQRLQSITEEFDKRVASINLQLYTQAKTLGETNEEARIKLQYQFDTEGSLREELALIDIKTERQRKILELKLMESTLTEAEKNNLRSLLEENAALLAAQARNNYVSAMLNNIEQTARSVWTNVTQGGQDMAHRVGQTLKAAVLDLLYQMTIKKWIISIGASVTGVAASASEGGGSGSALSTASTAYSAYDKMSSSSSWFTDFGKSSGLSINRAGEAMYRAGFEDSGAYLMNNAKDLGEAMNTAGTYLSYASAAYAAIEGKWGKAAGTAIGAYFAGPFGAAIGSYIGSWVDDLAGNTGARPSVEGGYASAGTQGSANGRSYVDEVYGGQIDQSAQIVVESVTASYVDAVKALGGQAGKLTAQSFIGMNQGDNGNPNKLSLDAQLDGRWLYNRWTDNGGTIDAGTTDQAMTDAVSLSSKKIILEALKVTDLGAALNDYLDSVVTQGKSLTEITTVMDNLTGFVAFRDTVKSLPFDYLTNASVAAANALVASAGGFDKFQSSLGNYVNLFFTEAEKTGFSTKALANGFSALGITMPAIDASTREWYKTQVALAGAQDLSIQANADLYNSLLNMANAVNALAPAAENAAAALRTAADIANEASGLQAQLWQIQGDTASLRAAELAKLDPSNRALQERIWALQDEKTATEAATAAQDAAAKAAKDAASKAVSDAKSAVDRAASAQRESLNTLISEKQATVTAVKSVFDLLANSVKELYAQVDSTAAMSAQEGRAYIAMALSVANAGGGVPDQAKLSDAISSARAGIASQTYTSQFEADRARLILAGQLSQLKAQAGSQLSVADQALAVEKAQLAKLEESVAKAQAMVDAFNGVDTSILSMADAMSRLAAAIALSAAATTAAATAAESAAATAASVAKNGIGLMGGVTNPGTTGDPNSGASFGGTPTSATPVAPILTLPPKTVLEESANVIYYTPNATQEQLEKVFQYGLGLMGGLPSFDVGTDYVPRDMLARVHKGERITPAAFNPAVGRSVNSVDLAELIALTRGLDAMLQRIASATSATADSTARVAEAHDGQSMTPLRVEVVNG